MRPRDLETLEFARVLEAIAAGARSPAGRQAVLDLRPATAGEAETRLDTLAELLALMAHAGRPPVGDTPLLARALAGAAPEGAALEPGRLAEVRDLLATATQVRAFLYRDPTRCPLLAAHADALPAVPELEAALGAALDDAGRVRDDATPELARARAATRGHRVEIEARLLRLVRDPAMAEVIGEQYVTLRNGRYVVPVRTATAASIDGVILDRSGSGETVFVEPLFAIELNNRLLLATRDEEAEEQRLRMALTTLVRTHTATLATIEAGLAAVDAVAAAAAFAAAHQCTRADLGAPDIHVRAARHPLLVASGRPVVAVDLLVPPDRRGIAITGPNAGGKTVALKTLGLCSVMAHAGLFIPAAAGSRLPALAAVLVDVGDEQSIDRDLSTFTGHVENLTAIAAATGPGVLVLLDEPGAGTDPIEGAALATGFLTHLLERGAWLVFTSHYPQVKTFALASPLLDVAAFDVDPATGAPRFELAYHTVGQSLALPIARRHGFPTRALAVAEALLAGTGESRALADAVDRLEDTRRAYEADRATLAREREALAAVRRETDELLSDLHARKRTRWESDLAESRHFLSDLQSRGRALLDELRARPDPAALRTFSRTTAAEVATRAAAVAPETPAGRIAVPGDMVEVVGRGIRGELVEVAGERARIQRGGLRFEVPASQLRVVDGPAPRERVAVEVVRPAASTDEINLIGRRAREALDALGTFLDRAVRSGLTEVRVIHGLGTGALRRAVHEFLDTSPYCARYRDADPSAGGAAVTIADLS